MGAGLERGLEGGKSVGAQSEWLARSLASLRSLSDTWVFPKKVEAGEELHGSLSHAWILWRNENNAQITNH